MEPDSTRDLQVVIWRALAGVTLGALALSLVVCVYVVGVSGSLRNQVASGNEKLVAQEQQIGGLVLTRQRASDCINEILTLHGTDPAIFGIIKKHFPEAKAPAAVSQETASTVPRPATDEVPSE